MVTWAIFLYQNVEDRGQGADESVDDHLHAVHLGHGPQGPQSSQRPHGLEDGDVSGAEQARGEVDEGHADDDEVEPAPVKQMYTDTTSSS